MRHRLKGRKLGRTTAHRQALERNLVTSLFLYGRVVTTLEKAKEFRGTAEHLITLGKAGGLHSFRQILSVVQDADIAKKIVNDVAKRFTDRKGGYTRVIKLGGCRWDGDGRGLYAATRLGDCGRKALWELVVKKDRDEELKLAGWGVAARDAEAARKVEKKARAAGEKPAAK